VDQTLAPVADELVVLDRQSEQAHPAVDVVADSSGRDHAVIDRRRGYAPDREAVALVDVRHRQRGIDDAGQRGDVRQLLE
jgi:hypothetical protein